MAIVLYITSYPVCAVLKCWRPAACAAADATSSYWGWNNKVSCGAAGGTYTFALWVGAGSCNTNGGGAVNVGSVKIVIAGNTITSITATLNAPYVMTSAFLYVGTTKTSANAATSFGSNYNAFTYKSGTLNSVSSYTWYNLALPGTPLWVLPGAVVVGNSASHRRLLTAL